MALTTGKVRLSYVHVWQPQTPQDGGEAKYSVTILIPKSDVATLNTIYAEMESVKQAGVSSSWGGVMPPLVKIPLYDGDGTRPSGEPFGEECRGHMVITASSKTQPQVVDVNVQPVLNQAEVYSGCYARVNINFFSYNKAGNKGLGCGLNCIQKIGDGEPLSGGVSAQEAFGGNNSYAPVPGAQSGIYNQPPVSNPYGNPVHGQMPSAGSVPYGNPVSGQMPAPAPNPYGAVPYPQQSMAAGIDPITGKPHMTGVMGLQ